MTSKPHVTIFTDGACSGNPGPGGWAAILISGHKRKEISGGYTRTTNNRMELMGVIKALNALTKPAKVSIHSDSKYVVDAMRLGWVDSWKKNNWKRGKKKEPVKNPDLWKLVLEACVPHEVEFLWVEGHADSDDNNRCDELAVQAYQSGVLEEDEGFFE